MDFSESNPGDTSAVTKSWIAVDPEDTADTPGRRSPVHKPPAVEGENEAKSGGKKVPVAVVVGKEEEGETGAQTPVSRGREAIHSDSSGESFDISDSLETFNPPRRNAIEQSPQLLQDNSDTVDTVSPASSVGALSEDEEQLEGTLRGVSMSVPSRKRRTHLSSSSKSTPLPATVLPSSSSSTTFSSTSSSTSASSSSPTALAANEGETGAPGASSASVVPCALPFFRTPWLNCCQHVRFDMRIVYSSLLSFLLGSLATFLWMKRKEKNARRETEISLRQLVSLKEQLLKAQEAEIKRLSFLFEKYLSRPLLLRYLPTRM